MDDFSKYIWLFPLQLISNDASIIFSFFKYVETQFSSKVVSVQTDGGGEFWPLHSIFSNLRINHRLTCLYYRQQNGSVERRHRHIVETGLSFLSHALIPQTYWGKAFQIDTYIINRMPTPILENKSPFDILMGIAPDYRVFGSTFFPNLWPYNKHKLDYCSK